MTGKVCSQGLHMQTKVNGWFSKEGLNAVDVLSIEQAKACLPVLDTEFKRYHSDVIESLDDESEMDREEVVMDEYDNRVAHIFVSLKKLSPPAEPTIKTESKELDILRRLLDNLERNVRKVNQKITPKVPGPNIDCCI